MYHFARIPDLVAFAEQSSRLMLFTLQSKTGLATIMVQ